MKDVRLALHLPSWPFVFDYVKQIRQQSLQPASQDWWSQTPQNQQDFSVSSMILQLGTIQLTSQGLARQELDNVTARIKNSRVQTIFRCKQIKSTHFALPISKEMFCQSVFQPCLTQPPVSRLKSNSQKYNADETKVGYNLSTLLKQLWIGTRLSTLLLPETKSQMSRWVTPRPDVPCRITTLSLI